jgi:hypothetical protein
VGHSAVTMKLHVCVCIQMALCVCETRDLCKPNQRVKVFLALQSDYFTRLLVTIIYSVQWVMTDESRIGEDLEGSGSSLIEIISRLFTIRELGKVRKPQS